MFTTPFDQDLQTATMLHSGGQLKEAEAIYRRILESVPEHPDALHLLGVIAMQVGQLPIAESLIRKAIQVKPDFPDALSNLGRLLSDQKRFPEAVEAYSRVVQFASKDPSAWYVLASTLRLVSRYPQGLEAARYAISLKPSVPEFYLEAGQLHRLLKQPDQAERAFRQAIAFKPDLADAHNLLGNTLVDTEKFDDAITAYRQAIALQPANAKYHFNLGTALNRANRREDALVELDTALTLDPGDALAHSARGTVLAGLYRAREAVQAHMQAVKLSPRTALIHYAIGESFRLLSDNKQAEAAFEKALELDPGLDSVWLRLGEVHMALGKFDAAAREFTKALELDPKSTAPYKHLSSIGRLKSDSEVNQLRRLLDGNQLGLREQATVGFTLGKLLDEREEFDEAFTRYQRANTLFRENFISEESKFSASQLHRTVDDALHNFTPEFFNARQAWGSSTDSPVFVVGMPRSGTTLVEQIAASHPDVFGAGERPEIRYLASQLGSPDQWTEQQIKTDAAIYLDRVGSLSPHALRLVDKLPSNIMQLGLIATLFPRAKIVVCKRDPLDNCLSCYFQWFARENLAYSYDLTDCATQLLEQDRLLAHWQKVVPNPMMVMEYEQMVADQETQSRRLIEFLGLNWHPACLEFFNTDRSVHTVSAWQVRQPIYSASVGRWRHYEKYLQPLLTAFNR